MLDSLFGTEMPLAVKFFLAFVVVLALILGFAWAIRRFGTGRLGASSRGRQPRLAVIDHATVDGRRRLILVRRDNVEHLLMIGGPTDVVVEPNIVRAVGAPRDVPAGRPATGLETLSRALPLPENGGAWPLQPEPASSPRPLPRVELPEELPQRTLPPSPDLPPRPQRDTLSALADELSTRPQPQRNRPAPSPRQQPQMQTLEPELDSIPEPRPEPRFEPQRRPSPQPAAAPASPAAAEAAPDADQSLADMAHRLETALRKPNAAPETRTPAAATPTPRPPRQQTSEPKPARPDAKPAEGKTALYDSLEQEMASLLGRPPKT
jgi:hypothetical protein